MSRALNNCRHVPGWVKPFLAAIKNGYSEKNAAQMAGEGSATIHKRMEKDKIFKTQYEHAQATRRPRGSGVTW